MPTEATELAPLSHYLGIYRPPLVGRGSHLQKCLVTAGGNWCLQPQKGTRLLGFCPASALEGARMDIRDDNMDLDEDKTMKVSLPKRLHLKLHSLKILTGTTVSEMVEEAVVAYFEERAEEETDGEPLGEEMGEEMGEEIIDGADSTTS